MLKAIQKMGELVRAFARHHWEKIYSSWTKKARRKYDQACFIYMVVDFMTNYVHKTSHTGTSQFHDQSTVCLAFVKVLMPGKTEPEVHCWRAFTSASNDCCVDQQLTVDIGKYYKSLGVFATQGFIVKYSDGCSKQFNSFRTRGIIAEFGINFHCHDQGGTEGARFGLSHSCTAARHGKCMCDGQGTIVAGECRKAELNGISLENTYKLFSFCLNKLSTADTSVRADRTHVTKYHNRYYLMKGQAQPSKEDREYMAHELKLGKVDEDVYPFLKDLRDPTLNFESVKKLKESHQNVTKENGASSGRTTMLSRRWPCVSAKGAEENREASLERGAQTTACSRRLWESFTIP
jgi:hypothetical protein